jgi:hypothetical protein
VLDAPPAGTVGLLTSGALGPGDEDNPTKLLVGEFASLQAGDFLTGLFDASFVDPSFSEITSTIVLGHEHQTQPVPEPSSVLLLVLGLASAMARLELNHGEGCRGR